MLIKAPSSELWKRAIQSPEHELLECHGGLYRRCVCMGLSCLASDAEPACQDQSNRPSLALPVRPWYLAHPKPTPLPMTQPCRHYHTWTHSPSRRASLHFRRREAAMIVSGQRTIAISFSGQLGTLN